MKEIREGVEEHKQDQNNRFQKLEEGLTRKTKEWVEQNKLIHNQQDSQGQREWEAEKWRYKKEEALQAQIEAQQEQIDEFEGKQLETKKRAKRNERSQGEQYENSNRELNAQHAERKGHMRR
jgi:hypothetical protein